MNFYARPASEHGFTLRELLVILVIIGILARVLMPKLSLIGTLDAAGYADQTEALLRYAQKTAIAQRRLVAINVTVNPPTICSQTYTFAPTVYPTCASGCAGGANVTAVALPSGSARAPRSTTTLSGSVLCFDAVGRPFASGSNTPLAAATTLTVSDGGTLLRTITVEPETGYVH